MRSRLQSTVWQRYLSLLLLFALVSCQSSRTAGSDNSSVESDKGSPTAQKTAKAPADQTAQTAGKETKDTPKPIAPALKPGQYCYQLSDKIQDIQTRLTVAASDQVTGNVQGTIHNDKAGYFTSYRRTVNGTIDGSNLNLDVATWIEYDQQNAQETWRVSPSELKTDRDTLANADCEAVNSAFQNESGLEAKDLTESANRVKRQEVFFDAGKSSTTVSDAVVRGDRDLYTLNARGGQSMDLAITSVENNAVFDVVDPSGIILGTELTQENIRLPHTGDYQIIVGGTRGNATYDLAIAIN
ncbi:MAG: hypothetical protein WBA76_08445 [Phormidesmis sp.]